MCREERRIQYHYNKFFLNSQEKEIYQKFWTHFRIQNHLVSRILYSIMYPKKEKEKSQSFDPLPLRQWYLPVFQNLSQKRQVTVTRKPLTTLYDPIAINWSEKDIKTTGKEIYERYIRSHRPYQFKNLCNVTRTQILNPNWKLHSAYRCDISNPSITFINTIMQYITVPNVKAIKYGRQGT